MRIDSRNEKMLDIFVAAVSLLTFVDAFMPFCEVRFLNRNMFVHLDDIAQNFAGARVLYILPLIAASVAVASLKKRIAWRKALYLADGFLGTVIGFMSIKQLYDGNAVMENALLPIIKVSYLPFGFLLIGFFLTTIIICLIPELMNAKKQRKGVLKKNSLKSQETRNRR